MGLLVIMLKGVEERREGIGYRESTKAGFRGDALCGVVHQVREGIEQVTVQTVSVQWRERIERCGSPPMASTPSDR
jgi:hypothetical protein